MTRALALAALLATLSGAAGAQPRIQSGLILEQQPALKPGDILRVTPEYTVEKIEYGVTKQLDDLEKRVQALEPKVGGYSGNTTTLPTPEMLKAGRDVRISTEGTPLSGSSYLTLTDDTLTRIYRAMRAKEPR